MTPSHVRSLNSVHLTNVQRNSNNDNVLCVFGESCSKETNLYILTEINLKSQLPFSSTDLQMFQVITNLNSQIFKY